MKIALLIISLLILTGCSTTATIVKKTNSPSKTITLEYGIDLVTESMIKASRKDAIVQAAQFCGKAPKIIAEETVKRVEADSSNELQNRQFVQLTFACN